MPTTYTESPRTRDLPPRYRVFLWQIVRHNGTRGHALRDNDGPQTFHRGRIQEFFRERACRGDFPDHRLNACVKELTS